MKKKLGNNLREIMEHSSALISGHTGAEINSRLVDQIYNFIADCLEPQSIDFCNFILEHADIIND